MNINFTDLEKLIRIAEKSDIHSLEVNNGAERIHIICQPPPDFCDSAGSSTPLVFRQPESARLEVQQGSDDTTQRYVSEGRDKSDSDQAAESQLLADNLSVSQEAENTTSNHQVVAPMLGTFYRRPEPSADEFVQQGDRVQAGQTLCVIEAMKIMHEVKAQDDGTIKEILIKDGEVVEYGQPLFSIDV